MGCGLKVEGVTEVNKGQREAAIFLDTRFGCWILGSSEATSSLWPEVTQDSFPVWEHLLINCILHLVFCFSTFLCLHHIFCLSDFFILMLIIFWEICGFKATGQTEAPPLDTRWRLGGRRGLWQQNRKTLLAFLCAFLYVCACACGFVCAIKCDWMCGCGELHTNILYNTASAICHHGEFTHELNCDKEQIYLKHLCYILWTTVKNILFFYWIQKNGLWT